MSWYCYGRWVGMDIGCSEGEKGEEITIVAAHIGRYCHDNLPLF